MLRAPRAPWVTYHNIVGMVPTRSLFSKAKDPTGDGVVAYDSAHMDDVVSEIKVGSEHQEVHRHPKAIFEVRRILREHLNQVQSEYRVAQRLARGRAEAATRADRAGLLRPARVEHRNRAPADALVEVNSLADVIAPHHSPVH